MLLQTLLADHLSVPHFQTSATPRSMTYKIIHTGAVLYCSAQPLSYTYTAYVIAAATCDLLYNADCEHQAMYTKDRVCGRRCAVPVTRNNDDIVKHRVIWSVACHPLDAILLLINRLNPHTVRVCGTTLTDDNAQSASQTIASTVTSYPMATVKHHSKPVCCRAYHTALVSPDLCLTRPVLLLLKCFAEL